MVNRDLQAWAQQRRGTMQPVDAEDLHECAKCGQFHIADQCPLKDEVRMISGGVTEAD